MNVRLDIEYDGAGFSGWQRQPHRPTIQAAIEDSLKTILKRPVIVYGASRTDAGVHAANQVAHFHLNAEDPAIPPVKLRMVLNRHLPPSIKIQSALEVPDTFHAQKNARSKQYHYRILNRSFPSALDQRVYFHPFPVDWSRVREALPRFLGTHDFRAFQAQGGKVRSTVRTIYRFDVIEERKDLYRFEIEGNGFLKQMVRGMVGTLIEIGEKKREPSDVTKILASRMRIKAGKNVPGCGLCLMAVRYS